MEDQAELVRELQEAVDSCKSQLVDIEALLLEDPGNTDALELRQELTTSLAELTAQALELEPLTNTPAPAPGSPGALHAEPPSEGEREGAPSLPTSGPAAASHLNPRLGAAKMHPDNIYCSQEPDFAALAARFPYLRPHVVLLPNGRGTLDFTSWEATFQLTRALLEADHGVQWSLPEGQLVPPLPNRLNYIHWVNNLLQLSAPLGPVRGLDIGCGANLIYCLLGAAVYGWTMVGVDVTQVALTAAAANRDANPHLQHLLEVRRSRAAAAAAQGKDGTRNGGSSSSYPAAGAVPPEGILLPAIVNRRETFHFCMCNPPFFTSIHEANQNPGTACGGTREEMVCEGGELAFVQQMIADSQVLGPRIHWYTSMLGKKATLKQLRKELHSFGVTALRTTELVQGKTSRWAVAWSFAVDPNLATQPLPKTLAKHPSAAGAAAAAPVGNTAGGAEAEIEGEGEPRGGAGPAAAAGAGAAGLGDLPVGVRLVRRMVWGVGASTAEGPKLLSAMGALLGSYGATARVEAAAWLVEAVVPFPGVGGGPGPTPAPEGGRGGQGGRKDDADGKEEGPSRKKQRNEGDSGTKGTAGGAAEGVPVRLRLVQEQRKGFTVTATIANTYGELEARLFMSSVARLKDDLSLMWDVS